MKVNDLLQEGYYDLEDRLVPYVEMGQKIASGLEPSSGVKFKDDEKFNLAAVLGGHLRKLGDPFGPKSPADALKKSGASIDDAKEIFALVKHLKVGAGVKDAEPSDDEDDEEDF